MSFHATKRFLVTDPVLSWVIEVLSGGRRDPVRRLSRAGDRQLDFLSSQHDADPYSTERPQPETTNRPNNGLLTAFDWGRWVFPVNKPHCV